MKDLNIKEKEISNNNLQAITLTETRENDNDTDNDIEYVHMWKISDFTDEIIKLFQDKHNITIKTSINTINNYFRDLEAEDIHYVNRSNNEKVYDELDLSIAEYIIIKRREELQENGVTWKLKQIYEAIKREFPCRQKGDDIGDNQDPKENLKEEFEEFKETVFKNLDERIETLGVNLFRRFQEGLDYKQELLELKQDSDKKINETVFETFTKMTEFRTQAWEEWEKKPNSEKYEGLLFKRERSKAREEFINNYIEKKLLEWQNKQLSK